jgi:hypothetical protein
LVAKLLAAELDALKPRQAKWVKEPLPQRYAPGFDAGSKSQAQGQAQAADAPTELADDIPEDQLQSLAALLLATGELKAVSARTIEPWTRSAAPSVRAAAFVGLAGLGAPGLASAATGLFDPEREVQGVTAQALAAQRDPGISALLAALPKVVGERSRLLQSLAALPLPPTASASLAQIAQGGGPDSSLAVELLGKMGAKDAVPSLLKILDDPTAVARCPALHALGELGEVSVADAVAKDLFSDSPEVRAAAAAALARVGGPAQVETLLALRGDYYLQVRQSAERALSKLAPQKEATK